MSIYIYMSLELLCTVFVHLRGNDLLAVFRYGEVVSVRMLREKRCAFVNFAKAESSTKAMKGLQVRRNVDL